MTFDNNVPEWKNEGSDPPDTLKEEGFTAGYRPPAAYFNWFFNRIQKAVKEVQEKLVSELKAMAFKDSVSDDDINNISAEKVTQNVTHRMVSDTEKTAWNGKVTASGGDISATKITSLDTITTEFPEPTAGENIKTFLGKVKKFISDFVAIKDTLLTLNKLVNNGQTTASGFALDARYGKILYDLLSTHKTSGDHDSRYYTESEVDAKFSALVKTLATSYTGNGSGRRTINVSNFTVYGFLIKPNNNIYLFGGDGGENSYTVTEDCNQSGVTYYVILFGK